MLNSVSSTFLKDLFKQNWRSALVSGTETYSVNCPAQADTTSRREEAHGWGHPQDDTQNGEFSFSFFDNLILMLNSVLETCV